MTTNSHSSHLTLRSEPLLQLPCCYFPTRAVIVAQTPGLSQNICQALRTETSHFENPHQAFDFLKSYYPKIIEHSWIQTQINAMGLSIENVDTAMVQSIMQNSLSTQDISVMCVEHEMPSLNGLELLTKLSDKPFKMVLLVEPESVNVAQNLLDRQYIQQYFIKNDPDLPQKVSQCISALQRMYFNDLSRESRDILMHWHPLYSDQEMIAYLDEKIEQHQIAEFYLSSFQNNGVSYLCVDHTNQKYIFSVYTQQDLDIIADYGKTHGASSDCVEVIQTGQKIPVFGVDKTYRDVTPSEWANVLLPAESIQTATHHYFAVLAKI